MEEGEGGKGHGRREGVFGQEVNVDHKCLHTWRERRGEVSVIGWRERSAEDSEKQ